ncbi:hypothetical protein L596_023720 [Steinernema carpocapsae]|uniref:Uncharacterized protein n=1 Tax=Steinernema carpocapsae TaxID=34508 RepID=A0A4U5MEF2_STECR|nr:hypothetical protein L596_023699 [Steinernema carpocapsae]TKR67591.1 hypothetical protein L596_023720 [Steinernema carpocapsae]
MNIVFIVPRTSSQPLRCQVIFRKLSKGWLNVYPVVLSPYSLITSCSLSIVTFSTDSGTLSGFSLPGNSTCFLEFFGREHFIHTFASSGKQSKIPAFSFKKTITSFEKGDSKKSSKI